MTSAARWRLALARALALALALGGMVLALTAAAAEPTVAIVSLQSGTFSASGAFTPGSTVPMVDGQEFGWRAVLRTRKRTVRVVEELSLPREPTTWGDPEPGLKRKTSPDGRTATTELHLEPLQGVIQWRWTTTTGDPAGPWVIKLRIEDLPERVLRLQAR